MEVREIKDLAELMREAGLIELEIENKQGRVRLVRGDLAAARPAAAPAPPTTLAAAAPARADGSGIELAAGQTMMVSPMVGTFYRSPSPESPPFVQEGDTVRKGQTLCIIEAMKMMNEIEAEIGGRLVRILAENGQPVQYGQALMVIESA